MVVQQVVAGAAALVLSATGLSSPSRQGHPAATARSCSDVSLVWAGGRGVQAVRDALRELSGTTVRLTVGAEPAPKLVEDDWAPLQEKGLGHPHFSGYKRAARRVVSAMAAGAKRCPDMPVVVAGHSEGAVAARLARRLLAEQSNRPARQRVALVLLTGDPLVEPTRGVRIDGDEDGRTRGFLVGRGPALPTWAARAGVVRELCGSGDIFCDSWRQQELSAQRSWPVEHYNYGSVGVWTVGESIIPARLTATMVTGGRDRLDAETMGLPPVRLTAVRMPPGLRVQHRRQGDLIVGSARNGRQVLVVRARGVSSAPAIERELRIIVTGQRPAARGTVLVSRGLDGGPADAGAGNALLSANGVTVLFTSAATNLVGQRLPRNHHLFAWDRRTGRSELVGILPDGRMPEVAVADDVSVDGRRLLFTGDGGHWLRDRDLGVTQAVPAGAELSDTGQLVIYPDTLDGWSHTRAASADGRYVVQTQGVAVPSPTQYSWRVPIRVWDSVTGEVLHSTTISGSLFSTSAAVDLTDDGRFAVIAWSGEQGSDGSYVVDMSTGAVLKGVAGSDLDISDDSQWLLVPTSWWRLTLIRRSTSHAVELILRRTVENSGPQHAVQSPTSSRTGSAVAYSYSSGPLLPGVRSNEPQVYHWRDPG